MTVREVSSALKQLGEVFLRRKMQIVRCKISIGLKGGMKYKMILDRNNSS